MLSQKSEEPDEGSPIWYSIKQESIKALEGGSIDYTTISIDSVCEAWTSYGYEVFAPEVYTYDTEEGTETELRTSAKLQVGETSYFWISYSEPMEGNATEGNMRRLEFECYMEDSDTIADANAKAVGDEMVPLPMGIQFGDSFETVSNKLGVSAAGIERGTYTLYESEYVYVDYADPKHESDSTSRSIYLGGDGSSFFYIFDDNELTNYWVSLDIDYLARVQDVYVPDETESALNSQEKMDVWYAIHQESVEALGIVTINFETDSLEEIKEHYTTMGYSVSDNEFTTDGEDGDIVTYRGMDAYILAENADYFVSGYNVYKEGSSGWHERTFRFGSNAYDPEYAADEAWRGWHALQSPLPMGIQFDDSFETVSEKLGLTEANIEPGQYSSDVNGHLYVVYTAPEEGMEAYIYIGTDSYSFNYWFNSEGTLYEYKVNIIH